MKAVKSTLEVTLPKRFYFSDENWRREQERIFWLEWFCAGRVEQLARAGACLCLDVAGESILVVRGKDERLRAFYNVCRHRGSQLVDVGSAPVNLSETQAPQRFGSGIRCPYHAWTYELDGSLRTAPFLAESESFFKDEFALYPVGVDVWGGFFFVHLT